jgi:hypothetical protein
VRARLLPLLLVLAASPAVAECPLDLGHGSGLVVFSEHFIIAVRTDPSVIEVGEPFSLILNVCTKGGEPADLVGIDAQLDEKNVIDQAPRIVRGTDGRYRAEELVLTAPGSWEIGFNVRTDSGSVERLTHDLIAK